MRAGREEVLGGEAIDVLLDQRQRLVGHRRSADRSPPETRQPGLRLSRRARRVDEADAVARSDQIDADRRRRRLAAPSRATG